MIPSIQQLEQQQRLRELYELLGKGWNAFCLARAAHYHEPTDQNAKLIIDIIKERDIYVNEIQEIKKNNTSLKDIKIPCK